MSDSKPARDGADLSAIRTRHQRWLELANTNDVPSHHEAYALACDLAQRDVPALLAALKRAGERERRANQERDLANLVALRRGHQLERAGEHSRALVELVRDNEWSLDAPTDWYCQHCLNLRHQGHTETCPTGRALLAAEGGEAS